MDYVNPADVANAMVETASRKLALPTADLLVRGILSGAILGVATSLAFTGAFSTGQPLVGALIYKRRGEPRETSAPCRQSSAITETMQ
jgi:formate/nitrite transporter FocA (FNT family)